tara:strand:+ start:21222 stop:22190 length:969 start_codon:yes stop_codon:yes gene_type:complete
MYDLEKLWQKYLRRTLSREETVQFLKDIQNKENKLLWSQLLKKEWEAAENLESSDPRDRESLAMIHKAIGKEKRSTKKRLKYAIGSLMVLMLGIGTLFILLRSNEPEFIRLEVAAGKSPARFVLPDGSKVWLNAATIVEYQSDFKDHRNVKMEGEAYFEVAPNTQSRFTISFQENELVVTGTKFNVRSYGNDRMSEVALKEGHVTVYHQADSTKLIKDHILSINDKSGSVTLGHVDLWNNNDWKNGMLNFRNVPMDAIFRSLERYYGVRVELVNAPAHVRNKRITALFPKGSTLMEVLEGLRPIQHFDHRFSENNILRIKFK